MIDNEELDAVSICTYNATHAECAIYAMEHGIDVLLEKPMCVTTEEAVAIYQSIHSPSRSIFLIPRVCE